MPVNYPIINDTPPWTQSFAGINQTIFPTTWSANEASDILVYSRLPSLYGNDILDLVDSSLYNVAFIGDENIVQVTFLTAPLQGNVITITRNVPADWLNNYTNTNFTSSMLNSDFDTLTFVDQQNNLFWEQIAPRYNVSASPQRQNQTTGLGGDLVLPVLQANQFWVKNSANTAFIPGELTQSGDFPTTGNFVVYGPEPDLVDAFNLGDLSSGVLAQTVADDFATPYIVTPVANALMINDGVNDPKFSNNITFPVTFDTLTVNTLTLTNPHIVGAGGLVSFQVLTTGIAATYTKPAGIKSILSELVGAGGGGGGSIGTPSNYSSAGGGGAGGYTRLWIPNAASTYTYTIGTGGAGGLAGTNPGQDGGTTTFSASSLQATGGKGALGAGSSAVTSGGPGAGGAGGIGTNGIINTSGQPGSPSINVLGSVLSGNGGSSFFGGGAVSSGTTGNNASAYGSGGSGASSTTVSHAGGAGSDGVIVVWEFC